MAEKNREVYGSPLIIIGDRIAPKPYLVALMQELRIENKLLDKDKTLKYAVCQDIKDVVLTLRQYKDAVRMVMIGPGMEGNALTVARMLASKAKILMVIDPNYNPLGPDPATHKQIKDNLIDLGIILVLTKDANNDFFRPLIQDYIISQLQTGTDIQKTGTDIQRISPAQRREMVDKRLNAITAFPSLPETQRKVAELDDLDPPKKWAEAIAPDPPTRTVILRILNSARYGFRSRIETIDKAVALARAKTIREIVTACQIRQIFKKTTEKTIDQYWQHSLAVGFYAKLFALPATLESQSPQQKAEFERFQLEEEQVAMMQETKLWTRFDLAKKDDPFISGIMHDVGKVAMTMCMEDSQELITTFIDSEFQEQKAAGKLWAHSVLDIERFLMKDMDHQIIGHRLAETWEMDPGIQLVIGHHHDIHEHSPDLLKLIALADLAASTIFPYPATLDQHPLPLLFEQIEKDIKKKDPNNLSASLSEVINQDVAEDLLDGLNRLGIPNHIWEIVDFRIFFQLCYILSPQIKRVSIGFLQQTGS